MLYQYVKRYLKKTFGHAREDFNWDLLDNIHFSTYIEGRYTTSDLMKESSELKEAFKDFLSPIGKIIFRYTEDNGIKIKIFPYRVKPEDSKHLKSILKIIGINRKYIKYPYQNQNDQIAIMGKIRRDINRELFDTQESVNPKELIKHAIKIALKLSEEDVITQLKRKYIVKIFQKNEVLEADVEAPSEREGIQNRYNGYTAEEIEETYTEIFERGKVKVDYFLVSAMKAIFTDTLDFRRINNRYYEEKALKVIHAGLSKELDNYIELEEDYAFGVSGYLMRKYFYKIHELMAIELIERIYDKDKNANTFLLFYNGKTILIDHKKYVIPSLETADGKQWNNSSLIGICNLWMNTKKRKEIYEHKIVDTDMKLNELKEKLAYIQPEKEAQEAELNKVMPKYELANTKHQELEIKLKYLENASLNSNDYFKTNELVKKAHKELNDLDLIVKQIKTNLRVIKDSNMSTYTELEYYTNQKQELLNDIKAQNLNINAKSAQTDPIIESIIKVLMARTKLMENEID